MQKVLLCGAGGGIGSATLRALIEQGIRVIGVGHHEKALQEVADEVRSDLCTTIQADVGSYEGIQELARRIKTEEGNLDWVINAAGFVDTNTDFGTQTEEAIETTFRVNTLSTVYLTQHFLPLIHTGGFIYLSSTAGLKANPEYPVYSASKAAVNSFSQAVSRRYPDRTFISVCPGPTNTNMRERLAGDAKTKQEPTVVAALIVALVKKTPPYASGDVISIRNGTVEIVSRIE